MTLSKDQIVAVDDLETRTVEVPEWGGSVNIKALSGTDRNAFETSVAPRTQGGTPNVANVYAKLVARCLVDDTGERMFAENEVTALGKKSAAALSRLFEVASEMCGLSEDDVDELAKNSEGETNDDSISSSPEMSLVAP